MSVATTEAPAKPKPATVTVDREALTTAVTFVQQALPARPALPVLAGIKFTAERKRLRIAAFDYEISTRTWVEATNVKTGEFLLFGRKLADILKVTDKGVPITFTYDGSRKVIVQSGGDSWTLQALLLEDYPALPPVDGVDFGSMPVATFVDAVTTVGLAVGRDDTLPPLTCIRFAVEGNRAQLAATDRYRLAWRELRVDRAPRRPLAALVPSATVDLVAKWAGRKAAADDTLAIRINHDEKGYSYGIFEHGNFIVTGRLQDGEFPKWEKLVPTEFVGDIELNVEETVKAIKKLSVAADRNTPIRIDVDGKGADRRVISRAGMGDEIQAEIPLAAAKATGDNVTIALNPGFMADAFKAVGGNVHLQLVSPTKPVLFEGDGGTKYLQMPVRMA